MATKRKQSKKKKSQRFQVVYSSTSRYQVPIEKRNKNFAKWILGGLLVIIVLIVLGNFSPSYSYWMQVRSMDEELMGKVQVDDVEGAKDLLEQGANPNYVRDEEGRSCLLIAVATHNLDMVHLLIKHHARLEVGQIGTGVTPLLMAVRQGDRIMVERLITAGADIRRSDLYGDTPLHMAVTQPDIGMIDLFVKKGLPVDVENYSGITPLHKAVTYQRPLVIETLLKLKADPSKKNYYGLNAVSMAIQNRDEKTLKLLLDMKPSLINSDWKDEPLLHQAVKTNSPTLIKEIVKKGAFINQKNKSGETALVYAVKMHYLESLKTLLELKADPTILDPYQKSLYQIAEFYKDVDTIQILKEHGITK